jgi:hypothetical protein
VLPTGALAPKKSTLEQYFRALGYFALQHADIAVWGDTNMMPRVYRLPTRLSVRFMTQAEDKLEGR